MARIVVIGGGLIGLATAMMTARQGHHVTVLERDPAPPPLTPGAAWDRWERHGVLQFRQPHFLLPAGFRVLEAELPEAVTALREAGAAVHRAADLIPGQVPGQVPGQQAVTLTARRPVLEYAMAAAAAGWVDIRRGARATGLLFTRRGLVQVTGVVLADRTELAADLVIDAMGRVSALPSWLTHIGAGEMTERAEPPGLSYYSRYFRAEPGTGPGPCPGYGLTHYDGYSILVTPADAGTWSVTVCAHGSDTALRALRSERNWTRFVGAGPAQAPFIAGGQPIGGVLTAGGVPDRVRGRVRHGVPAATGVLSVGDAWGCTSPAFGRGLTLGLMHAVVVATSVADHVKDPLTLALDCDRLTRERVLPWYRNTANQAAAHAARLIAGTPGHEHS
jgi:2-polyprenyl-6-methoxyphenol hydroxylase-like FAD-dependent oxidoreductase